MKNIELKIKPTKRKKIILSRDKRFFPLLSKTKIIYNGKAGWCMKYGFSGFLTANELRVIAKEMDKLNK